MRSSWLPARQWRAWFSRASLTGEVMPTHGELRVGDAVHEVTERAKSLVRLEVELALVELRRKGATVGLAVGLVVAAALLAFYAVAFLFATAAAGLATALPVWLSTLIV